MNNAQNHSALVSLAILGWLGISVILFFSIPDNIPLLTVVYPAFFNALFSIQWNLPDSFFENLLGELLSLGLHGILGVLFLRLFLRLPKAIEWIAGVFLGIGLATFILELWAIPFLLNRWTVLFSLLLIGMLFTLGKRYWGWAIAEDSTPTEPIANRWHRGLFWCAWGILGAVTVLSFYHALFFPVHYWDALILYIHYGKMTYQQGGFPILVCLQVGLGLGANYPHLYPLHQATTAMLVGHWSDLYGQLLPPLAGLGSIVVLYVLALRLFRNRFTAVFSVLVFRCIPYVSTYFVWASDYSLVMLYTALFLLFLETFLSSPSMRKAIPLLAVCAIFPHINYMGWIVWPPMVLAILWRMPDLQKQNPSAWMVVLGWGTLWLGLGLTWYIRNWLVTGNPVYAFFPQIFGGKNINLDVLASCNREWTAHGLGAAQFGNNLGQKIWNSFTFFQKDWRFSPLLTGILLPGFLLGWKRNQPFYWISALLFALYFLYQYKISGLYWYHTIAVFPILALFVGRFVSQILHPKIMTGYGIFFLIASLVPGVSTTIMGPKMPHPTLPLFTHPGISVEDFYRYSFPNEAPVWRYINENVEEKAIVLSHDNRYHVYRDDIQIIHLDDCGLTDFYGQPYPVVHQELIRRGIRYYLYIPDERSHPITAKLGHLPYLNDPNYFELLSVGGNDPNEDRRVRLYRVMETAQR